MSFFSALLRSTIIPYRKDQLDHLRSLPACLLAQRSTLFHMTRYAQNTQFGLDHGFSEVNSVAEYQRRVPIRTYEDFFNNYFKPAGESAAQKMGVSYDCQRDSPYLKDITWPGLTRFFSLSSGTTSGTTKFIPLTQELLFSNYKASIDLAVLHSTRNRKANALQGKIFLLGGNTNLRKEWDGHVQSGDLSGVTADQLPWFAKMKSFPKKNITSISDWNQKTDQAAEASLTEDVGILGGVPSWVLLFLDRLNQKKRFKGNIKSVWPSFELLIHGGVAFDSYRAQFEEWLGHGVYYQEVYPASEAFIAMEDPYYHTLRLMVDYGVFYEFVPLEELNLPKPTRHTLAEVELGQNYAIALTTCGGLWSYLIGDTVRFVSKDPPLLKITGRTKFFLSAFGEHLIQEEIEKALTKACQISNAQISDYHVAPIFPHSKAPVGKHQYLIEFVKAPQNLEHFQKTLDQSLQELNEDYAAHRANGFGMAGPELICAPNGFFNRWMTLNGKLGAQHKFPRIANNRKLMEELLSDNSF